MAGYTDIIMFQTYDKKLFETELEAKFHIKDKVCEKIDNIVSKDIILSRLERVKFIEALGDNIEELYKFLYKVYGEI